MSDCSLSYSDTFSLPREGQYYQQQYAYGDVGDQNRNSAQPFVSLSGTRLGSSIDQQQFHHGPEVRRQNPTTVLRDAIRQISSRRVSATPQPDHRPNQSLEAVHEERHHERNSSEQHDADFLTAVPHHIYVPIQSDVAVFGALLFEGQTPIPPDIWEYTFRGVHYADPFAVPASMFYFSSLPDDFRSVILDRLAEIRPFHSNIIPSLIESTLTTDMARILLYSTDWNMIEQVALYLLPDRLLVSRDGTYPTTWMDNLSSPERKEVMRRLSEITLQDQDRLRDYFLEKKIKPSIAEAILRAEISEQVWSIVTRNKIFLPPVKLSRVTAFPKPWRFGLSPSQKAALLERMIPLVSPTKNTCYSKLRKPKVRAGYGFDLLKMNDREFVYSIEQLEVKSKSELPRFVFG
jgi:hypothetical protein